MVKRTQNQLLNTHYFKPAAHTSENRQHLKQTNEPDFFCKKNQCDYTEKMTSKALIKIAYFHNLKKAA